MRVPITRTRISRRTFLQLWVVHISPDIRVDTERIYKFSWHLLRRGVTKATGAYSPEPARQSRAVSLQVNVVECKNVRYLCIRREKCGRNIARRTRASLEYRGDSAGIHAAIGECEVGRRGIALRRKIARFFGTSGIAHLRWATHGEPTKVMPIRTQRLHGRRVGRAQRHRRES